MTEKDRAGEYLAGRAALDKVLDQLPGLRSTRLVRPIMERLYREDQRAKADRDPSEPLPEMPTHFRVGVAIGVSMGLIMLAAILWAFTWAVGAILR